MAQVKKKAADDSELVESLVEEVIDRKLKTAKAKRPRLGPALTGANLMPIGADPNNDKEDQNLLARKSL